MRDEWTDTFAYFLQRVDGAPLSSQLRGRCSFERRCQWRTLIWKWRENERKEETESCRGFDCRTLEHWVGIKTSWLILTLSSSCFCKMERRSVTERGIRDATQALRTWECVQPALPAQPVCSVCTWTVSVYKTWASHPGFLALSLIE